MSDRQAVATAASLRSAAAAVLARNDAGGWTRPAPRLYPHQWSWDSAFAAIGWCHLNPGRAIAELERLFAAQWQTGMVPYLVYDPQAGADAYFPDADRWDSKRSPNAPAAIATGGLCQPPVHAIAVLRICEAARRRSATEYRQACARIRRLYPALLAWHRYLATYRDPERTGLVTVYHPWESGTDNSPRWDAPLSAVPDGEIRPFTRRDVAVITDRRQRPTNRDYQRYVSLLDGLRERSFDEAAIAAEHPFAVRDILFSAIFAAANDALLQLHDVLAMPADQRRTIAQWRDRTVAGLRSAWDAGLQLCLDYDIRADATLRSQTVAGLAPLLVRQFDADLRQQLMATLRSARFLNAPGLTGQVLPTTSPADPAFDPRKYWRGPSWPVITWLFWWALTRAGETELAAQLRAGALELISAAGFAEYFQPYTGEPLGSADQSWTAAVTLDWLTDCDSAAPADES